MKLFRVLTMTTFFMIATLSAELSRAQHQNTLFSTPSTGGHVHFIGINEGMLVFEVQLENVQQKEIVLTIDDENGYEIYSERIEKPAFIKRYKIEKNAMNKIQFNIKEQQKTSTETFNVNYKLEEKFEISKA